MFHKLRLKLTLLNATVIFLLFLILIVGTYYYAHEKIIRLSDDLANKILMEIKTGNLDNIRLPRNHEIMPGEKPGSFIPPLTPDKPFLPPPTKGFMPNEKPLLPPDKPPGPNFFFVILTSDGTITTQSNNLPLTGEKLTQLVTDTLETQASKGSIIYNETEYRYIKAPMNNNSNTILLFQDFSHENNILRIQLTALALAGLICLILSLLGSFWMADRAMIPIQRAWQQQKDFLSDASHELRTPLTVIQTNLDVVMDSPDEKVSNQLKWLENIQEESTRMAGLVDSLLFLARTDSHQQMLEIKAFSLTRTLFESAASFKPLAESKDLTITATAPQNIVFHGDKNRIKQVISIILDNAIRHTSSGKITLTLTQTAKSILLTITDSGEGIAPEYIDKIFDRFYQIDKARSKGGAGLGLSIAKSIIENHKGNIKVNSTLGFGTTFTISLPGQKNYC